MASIIELDYYGSHVKLDPMEHASSEATYGLGDSSLYGHVKLSDDIDSVSDSSSAVAATPKAVNTVSTGLSTHASCEATNEVSAHVTLSDSVSDSSNGVSNHIAATPKAVNTVNTSLETHASTNANTSTIGHTKISDSPNNASTASTSWAISPKGLYDHTVEYANASSYGHTKITDSYATAQSGSTAANHWAVSPSALYTHDVRTGSGSVEGHVKLSDSISDATNDSTKGIAATPKAVNSAYSCAASYGANLSNATGILTVGHGGTGMSTASSLNAVVIGNGTDATGAMQTVATKSGALYGPTTANGKPAFGTLPIGQGGTGRTTIANGAAYATSTSDTSYSIGTLPVAQGGTGLTSSPSMLVNLQSTTASDVLSASPRPGVTGILSKANGGTGRSDATAYISNYTLWILL